MKKNIKVLLIVLLIVLSAFLVTNLVNAQDYVPGEIIVGFNEGLTKIDAENLINSYNLEIKAWSPPDFTYAKIKVLEGNREDYIALLENHSRIGKVKIVNETDDELLIYFYIPDFKNLKLDEVEAILNEFENIELVHDEIYDKFMKINRAVVKVPEGEEQKWIETFEKENIVRYAELNGIATILVKSNYIYYFIPIIIILLIILYLLLRKKKK